MSQQELYKCWEEKEWRREKVDGLWVLRMAKNLIFWQDLPLFFLRPAKNQQANEAKLVG